MNGATRIVIAIRQVELDGEHEGMDDFMRGQIEGYKHALAIIVGEQQAARLLGGVA